MIDGIMWMVYLAIAEILIYVVNQRVNLHSQACTSQEGYERLQDLLVSNCKCGVEVTTSQQGHAINAATSMPANQFA